MTISQRLRGWLQAHNKRSFVSLTLTIILGLVLGVWLWWLQPTLITVQGLGQVISFESTERDLGAALARQGILLMPQDQVTPALDTELEPAQSVNVQVTKAFPVKLTADGKTTEVLTVGKTVAELLDQFGVLLGPKDEISVAREQRVTANMEIRIVRRTELTKVNAEEIPFETVKREDESMVEGETREIQAGAPGLKEVTVVAHLEDGKEIKTEVIDEQIVRAPTNRIVAYGTAGVVSRGGRSYRYVKEMEMSATGYTAGPESNPNGTGLTYTGIRAVRGVVAVDPNVIPLGTRVYVEGYGQALAADIGGAIKGYKIDLCFDTVAEALEWGRRPVKVYILGD